MIRERRMSVSEGISEHDCNLKKRGLRMPALSPALGPAEQESVPRAKSSNRLSLLICTSLLILLALASASPAALAQANINGQWVTLNTQMPINPVHIALMHNGKVLVVSGSGNLPSDTTYLAGV